MPTIVETGTPRKIPSITPNQGQFTNLAFPYRTEIGVAKFTGFHERLRQYRKDSEFKIPPPGEGLPRILHFCADQSGCAFWRMIWPGDELMSHNKAVVMTFYQMIQFGGFYQGITAIRLQRQCTPHQLDYIKFLRTVSDQMKAQTGKGFRIIWEVDDLILTDLIPNYNVCKTGFRDPQIEKTVKEAVHLCDEMTVVSPFMREIYKERLDFDRITVIPNYAPRMWIDRDYRVEKILANYRKHKSRPRVLYAGSGTHFDVANRDGQRDDFAHVVEAIYQDITTDHKYEWVFFGALPLKLRQFIDKGIEFHPWTTIDQYTEKLRDLNVNISIAPLQANNFSRAKANIKLTEAGSQGIPCIAQNIDCYNSDGWHLLFDTVEELMASLERVLGDEDTYMAASAQAREYSEKFILKDHLDEFILLYTTDYGDPKRAENASFLRNNPNQFINI